MFINIQPIAKPRMTRSDRWKQRPAVMRYWAFCDEIRLKHPDVLPPAVQLIFHVPIPASTSFKKTMLMVEQPHDKRPDLDNYIKSVLDALCEDDGYVYEIHAKKIWSTTPGISIIPL